MGNLTVVATSDWHGSLPESLPKGDVLAIVGDTLPVSNHSQQFQSDWVKDVLCPYLAELDYKDILLVGGNHDILFQDRGGNSRKWLRWLPKKVTYLQDDTIVINGVIFHGTPWSNWFGDWAFMLPENGLVEKWKLIPDDCDVLLVHGPPYGACDLTFYDGMNAGSKTLRERLIEVRPRFVICGHIHEGYGFDEIGRILVANVSQATVAYEPKNEPFVFLV